MKNVLERDKDNMTHYNHHFFVIVIYRLIRVIAK
jgi:hypothetical protein